MSKIAAICIKTDGSICSFKLDVNVSPDTFDVENIPTNLLNSKGTNELTRECDFDYANTTISLYAWTEGRAGKENKYELPPPVDNELYFGNMFAICHDGNNELISLSVNEWEDFYEMAFGGFEDLGSEDSYSEDDDEEDEEIREEMKDFIVDDLAELEEIEDESYHPSEESETESEPDTDDDYDKSELESDYDEDESEYDEDESDNDENDELGNDESEENENENVNDDDESLSLSVEELSVSENGIADTSSENDIDEKTNISKY